jgi:hypothetical protein
MIISYLSFSSDCRFCLSLCSMTRMHVYQDLRCFLFFASSVAATVLYTPGGPGITHHVLFLIGP